ncbi:MAG: hypothetical protein ABR551_03620 [Gemmatimonadales bacterium]
MRISQAGVVAVLGVLALGCDSATPLVEPGATVLMSQGAVLGGTNGGGQAVLPAGFSELKFSFTATALANGKAVGQFRQVYVSGGGRVDFHGRVTCMSVDLANGRAWIGGVITQNNSTNPAVMKEIHEPGRDVWFRVVDNGEGGDVPDRTTVFGFEGAAGFITSAAYCAGQPWSANDANTWAVDAGNIQVR